MSKDKPFIDENFETVFMLMVDLCRQFLPLVLVLVLFLLDQGVWHFVLSLRLMMQKYKASHKLYKDQQVVCLICQI